MCGSKHSNKVKETAQEVALSEVTQKEWNRFKSVYPPLIDKEVAYFSNLGKADLNRLSGDISGKVSHEYSALNQKGLSTWAQRGRTPLSYAPHLAQSARDMAYADTGGIGRAETGINRMKVSGLQNMAGLMRGDAVDSVTGLGDIAEYSVEDAMAKAERRQARRNDWIELGTGLAGAGLAAYNNKGTLFGSSKTKKGNIKTH